MYFRYVNKIGLGDDLYIRKHFDLEIRKQNSTWR